jgi:hypothetical protein
MNIINNRRALRAFFMVVSCAIAVSPAAAQEAARTAPVKVFLDCDRCFPDFLRTEVTFVDYVRDRAEANVHVLITAAETGSGGREYTLAFVALPPFAGGDRTLQTVTTSSDPEDVIRRQLANSLRVGLLNYVVGNGVPADLAVAVKLGSGSAPAQPTRDRWNNWVFSVQGSAAFDGEESSRERSIGVEIGGDRITPNWKTTLGIEIDHEREEFDLDEEDPVKVERRERDFQWLVVKALGEHWSVGAEGDVESTTFENRKLAISAAPAVEFNVFPYSMYTRRQLRALYAIGVERVRYYEETLFGKTEETLPQHAVSLTFEQRERWGSLEARTEWSQYLNDLSKNRLQAEAQVSVRLAKGLSLAVELDASRIRDQLFLPARGATPEEVFLRLRQLQSGYEYNVSLSVTYTFGSIFSSVVNPRFGQ